MNDSRDREAPVTQAQRETVVERLSSAFAHDVIEVDEFERRVGEAYRATTRGDLIRLTADLPPSSALAAGVPVPADAGDSPAPLPVRVKGVFSSVERGGYVAVPPRMEIVAHFASIELDLRNAWFLPGVTELEVRAVMGNVEILLPPDVEIENEGDWVICSVSVRRPLADEAGHYSTSVVRLKGRAVFSNIELHGKVPKKQRR
jgi:hypothetical protein